MCENRDAKLSVVYTVYNMKISSVNIEPVYTMGETLQKAGMNVVIGLCTVFAMLVLISLLISCFKVIPYIQGKMAKKNEAPAAAAEAPVSERLQQLFRRIMKNSWRSSPPLLPLRPANPRIRL